MCKNYVTHIVPDPDDEGQLARVSPEEFGFLRP